MAPQSKTEIYLKIKKPLLERQRRARINNCLAALKKLIAELQADEAVLRMDKAELLEQTLGVVRRCSSAGKAQHIATDAFRHGYMNAVNEASRVMASTPGMSVKLGKSVMTHLGRNYNRLQQQQRSQQLKQHHLQQQQQVSHHQPAKCTHIQALSVECAPLSPASSGYYSDCESHAVSPVAAAAAATATTLSASGNVWRPW